MPTVGPGIIRRGILLSGSLAKGAKDLEGDDGLG